MTWWKDIDINLDKKRDGDIKDFTDEEAIKQSIRNIFYTMPGSRRRLPEFAFNLYYQLFEPVDEITAREIGENLLGAIQRWDNRIIVEDLLVKPDPDKNTYYVRLTLKIRGVTSPESFVMEETIKAD